MSKLDNFIKTLNEGTIVDFTEHLEQSPTSFRVAMAERGIEIDALVAKDEPAVISALISKGYAKEHYETWKTHHDARVRSALALEGYWPDFFITDKKPDVRKSVAKAHHEYIPQILNHTSSEWHCALGLIERDLDIDLDILKQFLDAKESKERYHRPETRVVRLRYEAATKPVSPLEATMAPYDLLTLNNPLWVKGVRSDVAHKIIDGYECAKHNDQVDLFKASFGELYHAQDWSEYNRIANRVGLTTYWSQIQDFRARERA